MLHRIEVRLVKLWGCTIESRCELLALGSRQAAQVRLRDHLNEVVDHALQLFMCEWAPIGHAAGNALRLLIT